MFSCDALGSSWLGEISLRVERFLLFNVSPVRLASLVFRSLGYAARSLAKRHSTCNFLSSLLQIFRK